MKKRQYKITNWKQYNQALIDRGNITIWFSEDVQNNWKPKKRTGKRGHPHLYSDQAILTMLIVKSIFSLPLRALQGFMISLVTLTALQLSIPSYSQLSRRAKTLGKKINRLSKKKITDIVIDSTGLKVYGEGEWKVKLHGASKRRTWRKLHLAVCPHSHEIILSALTENSESDSSIYEQFTHKFPKTIKQVFADGAYSKERCYRSSWEREIHLVSPPQKNAVLHPNAPPYMEARNHAIQEIKAIERLAKDSKKGRTIWKQLKKYHTRSLVETAMFRFKTLFGATLWGRLFFSQQAEIYAKCLAMNTMTQLGMPNGKWIIG